MKYVIAIFLSFTPGTAMAYKYDVEPEKAYKKIQLSTYKQDGIKFGFEG